MTPIRCSLQRRLNLVILQKRELCTRVEKPSGSSTEKRKKKQASCREEEEERKIQVY